MKRSTRPKMLEYVRPWIWPAKRFSASDRKATSCKSDNPSGMNFRDASRLRPLMTSFSISQRTALDALTLRAYRLSRLVSMAFMMVLLHLVRSASNVVLAPLGGRTNRGAPAWHKRHNHQIAPSAGMRAWHAQSGGGDAAQSGRNGSRFVGLF